MAKDKGRLGEAGLYSNRELSWMAFNRRVLAQAADRDTPLFERMKFLSITATNLDEFFMVRVGALGEQVRAGWEKPDPSGLSPGEQLVQIALEARDMVKAQYDLLDQELLPALREAGLFLLGW